MTELKPCPFCGSEAIYDTFIEEYNGNKNPIIFCDACKAMVSVEDDSPYLDFNKDYEYRHQKMVSIWNKRVGEQNADG